MNSNFQLSNGSAVAMGGTTDESEQTVYCYGLWLDSGLNFGCTHPSATCKYQCGALGAVAIRATCGRFSLALARCRQQRAAVRRSSHFAGWAL